MATSPDEDAVLQRHGSEYEIYQPQDPMSIVDLVCPKPVVATRDGHTVRIEEHDEQYPGTYRKPVGQPVPRHGHQSDCQGDREHQGGRPDTGCLLSGPYRL